MKPTNYRWIICAGCTLLMFSTVGLISGAFSVYMPYIIKFNNFTNTQVSALITIRSLISFIALFMITKYYEKLDIREGVTLAGLSASIAFFLWSIAESYIVYSVAACFAGLSYALGGMIPITIIIDRWFYDKKALALGICASGTGASSVIIPPIITIIIEKTSLQTAFIAEACFILICVTAVFAMLRNQPEATPQQKDSSIEKAASKPQKPESNILTPNRFIAMLFATGLMGALAGPGNVHLAVLFKTEGYDAMSVAYVVSTMGLSMLIGKVLYGWVTDKTRAYTSNYIFFSMFLAGFFVCCLAGLKNAVLPFVGAMLLGIGTSLATVGLSVWASDLSNKRDFANNLKYFQITYVFGSIIFSITPGIIADYSGSYIPAYVVFFIMSVICLIIVQTIYLKKERHQYSQTT